MDNAIVEYVAKGVKSQRQDTERQEKESKSKAAGAAAAAGLSQRVNYDKLARTLENQCLHELSLKRLRGWIEEDEDQKLVAENEAALEKLREAKSSHESWLKKKDGMRIRMPANLVRPSSGSMSFGREVTGVRPTPTGVQ